jgi:hydrogenase maturation protease
MNTKQNKNTLIIGYGNTLRSDDGVGQLVSQEMEKFNYPYINCLYQHQLTPELVEKIIKYDRIILVDAKVNLDKVQLIQLNNNQNNLNNHSCWTHHINPQSLIYLTQFIYQKTPESWLITIPTQNLSFGENLSEITQKGKQKALKIITDLVKII